MPNNKTEVIWPVNKIRRFCRNKRTNEGDQAGSVLIVCLLVLVAVTIIGIAGINTGVVQLQIAANHKQIGHGFYLAEGAAMEAVARLSNATQLDLLDRLYFWHHARAEIDARQIDLSHPQHWPVSGQPQETVLQSALGPDIYMAAVEWDLAAGSSLVATESRLYLNRVFGKMKRYQADHLIEIGLNMRY
jgi:Tfp pilus assembly protein PilX